MPQYYLSVTYPDGSKDIRMRGCPVLNLDVEMNRLAKALIAAEKREGNFCVIERDADSVRVIVAKPEPEGSDFDAIMWEYCIEIVVTLPRDN